MKIQIENKQKKIKINKINVRNVTMKILTHLHCPDKEISISFVDDNTISQLNMQYLKKNNPTNVLSFSLLEGDFNYINPQVLGDIVISVETAQRDAAIGNFTLEEEINFLIIHGILHLLGFNHENTTDTETRKMQRKEKELFKLYGTSHLK